MARVKVTAQLRRERDATIFRVATVLLMSPVKTQDRKRSDLLVACGDRAKPACCLARWLSFVGREAPLD